MDDHAALRALKTQIARAQLGTALDLFLKDKDPLSVHALACGGCEVIEGLAEVHGIPTLSTHIMKFHPAIDMRRIKALRNQYWNGIKHFYVSGPSKAPRDDIELMTGFSDIANDSPLFMGWLDYLLFTGRLPVAAQVFQAWFYAVDESRMNPAADPEPWRRLFPDIDVVDRVEQKRRLRRTVEKYQRHRGILTDPRTELGPLTVRGIF